MKLDKRKNHFEGTGGRKSGEAIDAEKLAGGDTHNGRSSLGPLSQDGVTHSLVDLVWVLKWNSFIQLLVDLENQLFPVGF